MSASQQYIVTLPADMAELVEGKVQSGAYASASEMMREGVRALLEQDTALERWLREDVLAGHEEFLADPSKAVPAEQVLERIKSRRTMPK